MGLSTLLAADLRKIDPRARHGLATGELSGSIEVLLRTTGAMSDSQQRQLRAAGCDFRVAVGNVATGVIGDARQLEAVARLPFVRQVEVSRPLSAES
jgi:hypothetical protein